MKQRNLRKSIPLTTSQSKRLQELSDLDGLDPVEHAMRAIESYLNNRKQSDVVKSTTSIASTIYLDETSPEVKDARWLAGKVGIYEFSILQLSGPSKTGLEKGRISKLSIWDPAVRKATDNFIQACIVNFDRGWDIRPSRIAQPYYEKVLELVQSFQ